MMSQARLQSDGQHVQESIAAREHSLMPVSKPFVADIFIEVMIQPVFTAYEWTNFTKVACSDAL